MLTRVRGRLGAALGVVLLGALAGCSDVDLSKQNYQRTTVRASPQAQQGKVPTGPIDDPAVAAKALRTVDPCALLDGPAVASLTAAEDTSQVGWGVCRREMVDVGGKKLTLWLDLGQPSTGVSEATGSVAGLPLVERKDGEASCNSTAITSRENGLGIDVWAEYENSGNACATSKKVLRAVLEVLHNDPPRYNVDPASLLDVQSCGVVTEEALAQVFDDEVTPLPTGLHTCRFTENQSSLRVSFRVGYPIQGSPDDDQEEISLTDGVTAIREAGTTDLAECDVTWQHRGINENNAELVSLSYYDYSEDADAGAACTQVTETAKSLVTALPSE